MNSKELLKELNPRLFEGEIAPERFVAILIGEEKEIVDGDKKVKKIKLRLRTKPSDAAKAAGVTSQAYYRVMMESHGLIKINDNGEMEVRTKKKPYPHMVFANTQVSMYSLFDKIVEDWNNADTQEKKDAILAPMGRTSEGNPRFKVLKLVLWGKQLTINVPKYVPQMRGADGTDVPFQALKRNPKTGEYKKENVTRSVFEFWADEEDLEKLESVTEKMYENQIEPNLVETVTTIKQKGNKVTQEKVEPKVTLDEEDLEGNEGVATDGDDDDKE